MKHPSTVLHSSQQAPRLPVVDHYCGTQQRIRKALALQHQYAVERGRNVIDVTLDCEDGAPVGGEHEHVCMVRELIEAHVAQTGIKPAVRVHPTDHPSFAVDLAQLRPIDEQIAHIMIPKVESVQDIDLVVAHVSPVTQLHVLLESPLAISNAYAIAAHSRVQSISFGLMDFVSAHCGAIPAAAMTLDPQLGQFSHPIVMHAKVKLASACHAYAKVPSHCVVTEFKDSGKFAKAAQQVAHSLAYSRMWSIHPDQIPHILSAFSPSQHDVEQACQIIDKAQQADWAPISHQDVLHDRASYRYYWQVLQKAYATGVSLPVEVQTRWFS